MYWTDWGRHPRIERAGLDGTGREVLHQHNVTWPNGLSVDHDQQRLYWVDGGTHMIEFSDLDGRNRQVGPLDGRNREVGAGVNVFILGCEI